MAEFWQGIQFGLVLCIMAGPIFFALLQTGIEEGLTAGTMVAAGVWVSDLLFIVGVTLGLGYMQGIAESTQFELYLGTIGGAILLFFGLGTFLSKPPKFSLEAATPQRYSSWLSLWLKGFLVNTVNPFSFFFWIGIASTIIIKNDLAWGQTILFFSGIMGVIIITDILKVALCEKIRHFLKPIHVLWLRRVSGLALFGFGLALLIRVCFV